MELVSSINNSGIGAQYAVSAAKDVNGNEITSTYLTAVPEGYATESFVTSQGYITGNYLTADALDTASGTWNTVTDKLNTTAFSTVSGNFLTAHQSLPSSANWNATYTTVNGNSATWNNTYDTVHDNSASWSGGEVSITSPRGTININGNQIEGTNSAALTGTAGGYETYLLANNNYIRPNPDVLIDSTMTFPQTGGTLVIPIDHGDQSLYITVTGETNGGGTATASGQFNTAENSVYIPLGEMHGPFTAQASYWANLSTITLTASAAPTTGVTGVGELAWNSALNSVRNTSATWNSTYSTVSTNSASWGAGSTYTGDAQGALDEVYSKSGDWNTVTDKLDSSAFSAVSGDFLTAHQSLPNSGNWDSTYNTVYANSASWTGGGGVVVNTATARTMYTAAAYSAVTGFSGIDGVGPVVLNTGTVVANNNMRMQLGGSTLIPYAASPDGDQNYKWSTGNILLMSSNMGYGYYKGHQLWLCRGTASTSHRISFDVNNTTADVAVYNSGHSAILTPTGFSIWGPTTATANRRNIDSAVYDRWNSYSAKQDALTFGYTGDSITAINGSAVGGSIPEGVLVESGLEYNAANEISGYSGSAFAQPSISAAEWNSNYETVNTNSGTWNDTTNTVNTNSGAWGGSALSISAGNGISLSMVDGVLVISVTGGN